MMSQTEDENSVTLRNPETYCNTKSNQFGILIQNRPFFGNHVSLAFLHFWSVFLCSPRTMPSEVVKRFKYHQVEHNLYCCKGMASTRR